MFQTKALITEIKHLGQCYFEFQLLAPEIAAAAKAGQFIHVRVADSGLRDPLLNRPISLYRINPETGSVSIVFKVVGKGTASLASKKTGELLEVLGPLGNGFTVPSGSKRVALIAGGIGMPPLFSLFEQLNRDRPDWQAVLYYGARSSADLIAVEAWTSAGVPVLTATDDGSQGRKGLVTELFLEEERLRKHDYVAACGPKPMLRAVQEITLKNQIPSELSLEANMACGVGACLGCTCKTKHGYQRVCLEGPVFPGGEVVWE